LPTRGIENTYNKQHVARGDFNMLDLYCIRDTLVAQVALYHLFEIHVRGTDGQKLAEHSTTITSTNFTSYSHSLTRGKLFKTSV